jgi:hypothetical protein
MWEAVLLFDNKEARNLGIQERMTEPSPEAFGATSQEWKLEKGGCNVGLSAGPCS